MKRTPAIRPTLLSLTSATCMLGTLAPAAAAAQAEPFPRWSIAAALGFARGGPTSDIDDALRREGWDDVGPGPSSDSTAYPTFIEESVAFGLRGGYRFLPHVGVGVVLGTELLGHNRGHRGGAPSGTFLYISSECATLGPVVSIYPLGTRPPLTIRVDAGPALYLITTLTPGSTTASESATSVGLLVGAGLELEVGPILLLVDAQQRQVGELEYGPIQVGEDAALQTLPSQSADYSHATVLVGLGVKF